MHTPAEREAAGKAASKTGFLDKKSQASFCFSLSLHRCQTFTSDCTKKPINPKHDISMASSLSLPVQEAFEAAKRDFYQNLKNANDYDFSSFTSITDVYDTTEKIQTKQAKTGSLRYLNRIKPYLDVLCQYIGVLDTFSQVKADVTSLIWVE